MSAHNKVIWSEGLFLQPQHFQQQERYFERYVETRCHALTPHSWGFFELEIERDLLALGKFGLRRGVAVFPDGTPVRFPDDDPAPPPIEIGSLVRDQTVYLAVPLRRAQALEAERADGADELTRQQVRAFEARDVTSASPEGALLEVGGLKTRYLLQADVTPAYACVPLAHIVECRPDKHVVVAEDFIPTVLQVSAAATLTEFLQDLLASLRTRGETLGGRVSATGRGASAEISDFLMLQLINRYEPLVAHLAASARVHPEDLFQFCVSAAGELATFTSPSKRAPSFPTYDHERLRATFKPVITAIRDSLTAVIDPLVVPIPIEEKKYGIKVATVADRTLFSTAVFILAARADLPAEELRRRFPSQLKIGPVETIRDLVNLQLPGVPVHPVPVAPRQIPYHAGFVYFELDQTHELWARLKTSGGVGLFVPTEFPGLTLEFWAIRTA